MSFVLITGGTALLSIGEFVRSRREGRPGVTTAVLVPACEIAGGLSIVAGAIVLFVKIFG